MDRLHNTQAWLLYWMVERYQFFPPSCLNFRPEWQHGKILINMYLNIAEVRNFIHKIRTKDPECHRFLPAVFVFEDFETHKNNFIIFLLKFFPYSNEQITQ